MNDKDFLNKLNLKLMSYSTRIKDLETEIAQLKQKLRDKDNEILRLNSSGNSSVD